MAEDHEKTVLILNETNWKKWSGITRVQFKLIKAWDLIESEKKPKDFTDATELEKYKELALKVYLILLRGTEGDDNEIVAAQDNEDISAAWKKLVEKHEGNKDEVLLRTFDDIALESFKDMRNANIYVERYLNWANVIKNKAESVENLTKLVITTNMFRSLPNEFESVKERIRANLEDYDLQKIGNAIKTRAREIQKDEKYQEQFKHLKLDNSDEEIAKLNAEMNYVGFDDENWSDWESSWPNPEDERSGYSEKGAFEFDRDRPNGDRQWFGRGRKRNQAERERTQEPANVKSADCNLNAIMRSQSSNKPMKILGHMNAMGMQFESKAEESKSQKPRKIVGAMSAIMRATVESNRRISTENLRSEPEQIRSAARAPAKKAGNPRPMTSNEQMNMRSQ